MLKSSKHILTLMLTVFCLLGSQNLFGIFDLPLFYKWKKEMLGKIQNTFEGLFPEEERRNWKSISNDGPYIGDINQEAAASWIPIRQSEQKWSEQVSIAYICKPHRIEKRQYRDIVEAHENQKKNLRKEKIKWDFNKINDQEAVVELDRDNGGHRKIQRKILLGDWLITMSYEHKPTKEEDKELWEQKRDLWIKRFMAVKFT